MSRARRRIVVHTLVALGCAVAALGSFQARIDRLESDIGPRTDVLRLRHAVGADTVVTDHDVESVALPERWLGTGSISDVAELGGRVAGVDLPGGSYLTSEVLVARPEISRGERRAVALIDPGALGAGVGPGAHVDVVAAYDAATVGTARSEVVVSSARVLSVGSADGSGDDDRLDGRVAVAFALDPAAVLRLAFAEAASTVRLAAVPENSVSTPSVPSYSPALGSAP